MEEEEVATDDFVRFRSSFEDDSVALDPPPSSNVPNRLPEAASLFAFSLSFPFPFDVPTLPEVIPRKNSFKPPPLELVPPPPPAADEDSVGALVCRLRTKFAEVRLDEEAAVAAEKGMPEWPDDVLRKREETTRTLEAMGRSEEEGREEALELGCDDTKRRRGGGCVDLT